MQQQVESKKRSIGARALICALILMVSIAGFMALKSFKKPPSKAVKTERPIKVETIKAVKQDVPVILTGHGELKSIRTVTLSAEVAGTIIEIHPRLKAGEIIEKGELLFAIEDVDYRTDFEINKERLAILEKDLALSRKELKRAKNLFEKNKVGSISGVETTEKSVNNAADRVAQVRQAMTKAKINLERCRVTAPFSCRILSYQIEEGQYVSKGMRIATIADDSMLEVELPIYGKDAVEWLTFPDQESSSSSNWFNVINQVPVNIRWTETPETIFKGTLHRISSYAANTRSLKVAARVSNINLENQGFPLVAGMFVSVDIPGRTMEQVVELPRSAVSFENTVYVVRDKRLYTIPVKVIRVQGDHAYLGAGLENDDEVIVTRLINPLEGSLVEVVEKDGEA
jgi:multidrug efflux system membrane fusion protein